MYREVKEEEMTLAANHDRPSEVRELVDKPTNGSRIEVKVMSITPHGENVRAYEIVDPVGAPLPPFEPGSHIDVVLPAESLGVRQYSLCSDCNDCSRYVFAVQYEEQGRGGSKAMFELIRPGSFLTISQPRNNFPLRLHAKKHLLLAGGIGITPMIAMIKQLQRRNANFELHYCTRSAERTAFLEELRPLVETGQVFIHWDGGDPANGLDITAALKERADGTHLYYCGPPGFMGAIAAASAHWPSGTTHREFFTPSTNDPGIAAHGNETVKSGSWSDDAGESLGAPFKIKIASTGQIFDVPGDKSILHVLREHGIEVETACELGVCGTCRTRYVEGDPDHRDFVLEEDEQGNELTVCCSRSNSPLLVLDI